VAASFNTRRASTKPLSAARWKRLRRTADTKTQISSRNPERPSRHAHHFLLDHEAKFRRAGPPAAHTDSSI